MLRLWILRKDTRVLKCSGDVKYHEDFRLNEVVVQ